MTKSVMIVDDHPAIRVAIRALLSQSNEFSTIYESVDGSEALETLKIIRLTWLLSILNCQTLMVFHC